MIDLHSHVLPGLDDGAETLADSLALVREAVASGVRSLAATPHVRDDYPTTAEQMERSLDEVRAAVAGADVELELLPGGELALERLDALAPEELARFGLGGNPRVLLVEFPYDDWPAELAGRLARLLELGFTPVLAHPERNPVVQAAPERIAPLVGEGSLVQLTAASVEGRLGRAPRDTARRLLEHGLAHFLASDAHGPSGRGGSLGRAAESLRDRGLARWLTEEAPAALLSGEPLPRRPARARRLRLLR